MKEMSQNKPLKYGMVGGGEGSFIGDVHRKALGLIGNAEIVCGCFDIDERNNQKSGLKYGIQKKRIYGDFSEMAEAESLRPDRIDFVNIVTPNHLHYEIAKAFLSKGFNVVCEKPLCFEFEEGLELKKIAQEKGLLFGITYTYLGYPMVKQAKQLIKDGKIGEITVVMAEYAQAWVAELSQNADGKMTMWRNNPKFAGKSSCVGDIGTHIECVVSYITGLKIKSVCANLRAIGKGVNLDSNGEILVKYDSGASGMYWCSQVAHGYNNGLKVRIFGTKGSIEWEQEDPCKLKVSVFGEPTKVLIQGKAYLDENVQEYCRLPAGHMEGFYEAFANIYKAITNAVIKKKAGQVFTSADMDFAGIDEGLNGIRFIDGCVESSKKYGWVEVF